MSVILKEVRCDIEENELVGPCLILKEVSLWM